MKWKLYGFFRSGTSHRVRIALNLKNVTYEQVPVDLRREEHLADGYGAINPQHLVPALDVGGHILTQSPAILEWLEESHPTPPLLPSDPLERAHVRALSAVIGCDIHPINNRRILEYLRHRVHVSEEDILSWCGTWISSGFDAFEDMVRRSGTGGPFSFGAEPTLADIYLIPQMESARRFKVDTTQWPRLSEIDAACATVDAFKRAAPAAQLDAS
jgi:maleylpyruvate isomerase